MEYLNKLYAEIGNERLSLLTAWELVRTLSPFTVPAVAHRHKKQSLQELCLDAVRNAMEVPLLSWYLFPEVTSASVGMALNMATHIKATTLELIRRSPWLDGATKNAALHKLYAMTLHVGYPRYFNSTRAIDRTYRQYPDIAGSFFKPWLEAMNMTITWITTNHSSIRYSLVHTNAAFWHMRNMIVVPATILRNPMFSRTAPPAYNYGGLGHVMTHEMMHGFDRSGSRWDAHGEFRNWWSPDTRIKYEERISCLRRSHNASNANEDTENTADFAGLVSAYNAFLELVDKEQLKQYAELNYGAEQLFFIAACVKYCSQSKNQSFSGYASWQNRCNVPIRNLDAFGEAFNCPVGSYMRPKPADRCAFW
ncbi:hypothetical protein HPB48_013387 [Haemaphysalis longicornis]|uniref:Uncharacterized protein n=1 Tax=Haemaphysalis longicornis TaxID=44386 RepID=A0A9J6G7T0_HAELO|nr:hypothetical protein HPB48_013387 [Haemaphysalis longicornis]